MNDREPRKCMRCGYDWFSKEYPKRCANPECRSPYWDRKRVRPPEKIDPLEEGGL